VNKDKWRVSQKGGEKMNSASKAFLRKILKELFATQRLACLATSKRKQPYTSLVAFVATHDLGAILFVTGKSSKKYNNLKANQHVSMLVDNRTNEIKDFEGATAVTIVGRAEELNAHLRERYLKLYLKHHPYLTEFATSENSGLFRINVDNYRIVTRFQRVVELHL
jgi:nitroimidazol reductase NimA-like FMN-containing flavoprotein (pyridoxamine 5'-phosphate oxidase superfamily)